VTIGERMKEVRTELGYTQKEFAKILGVSQSHLSGVENGNDQPSETFIRFFATTFKISREWLVNGTGEKSDIMTFYEFIRRGGGNINSTSTMYTVFFSKLAQMLLPSCQFEWDFYRLINDERFVTLMNYAVSITLNDDAEKKLSSNLLFKVDEDFPGLRAACLECMEDWTTQAQGENRRQRKSKGYARFTRTLWEDARAFEELHSDPEERLKVDDPALREAFWRAECEAEERLLSHRFYRRKVGAEET
jgi:transcriptional regulator with XRE-family HTH domain